MSCLELTLPVRELLPGDSITFSGYRGTLTHEEYSRLLNILEHTNTLVDVPTIRGVGPITVEQIDGYWRGSVIAVFNFKRISYTVVCISALPAGLTLRSHRSFSFTAGEFVFITDYASNPHVTVFR